jgi:tRNA-specific 2-thiouridylase
MSIAVALSGGIDSSTVAYNLVQDGYDVVGLYMILHNNINHDNNISNIKKLSSFLNIKYEIIDLSKDFKSYVYDYFVLNYKNGLTPNPCIICNRHIKFGKLFEYVISKFDKFATGHYAKTDGKNIFEAKDISKDQSYFLGLIDKNILDRVIFPLGDKLKSDIKKDGLNIDIFKEFVSQKESSEICFVENSYIDILRDEFNVDKIGDVVDVNNNIIGKHRGFAQYTIGQRKGFDVPLSSIPLYVSEIDSKNNRIRVVPIDSLGKKSFQVRNINFDYEELECFVKVRYRSKKIKCFVKKYNDLLIVELIEKINGIATGQMAIFYVDDMVLGGGIID